MKKKATNELTRYIPVNDADEIKNRNAGVEKEKVDGKAQPDLL